MPDPIPRVDPPERSRPKGSSPGLVVPAGRRLLFVAGQVGRDEVEIPGAVVP